MRGDRRMRLPSTYGARAEKRVARLLGGCTRPASGARWFAKGDVGTKDGLAQVKSTRKKQYTLKLKDLQLIERQALAENRAPSFILEFDTPNGRFLYRVERFFL